MKAKKYLMQLKTLSVRIEHRMMELNQIKESAVSLSSPRYGDKIKSSTDNKSMSSVDRYVDLETQVESMIDSMTILRHEIINKIHNMDDPKDMEILYKRYVEFKSLELISVEMNYSYGYVRRQHGLALLSFERCNTK